MAFDFMFIQRPLVKAITESPVLKAPIRIYKTLSEPTAGSGSHCFPFIADDFTDKQQHAPLKSYNRLTYNQESLLKSSPCILLNINQQHRDGKWRNTLKPRLLQTRLPLAVQKMVCWKMKDP